jgi:hypothetical protein
MFFRTLVVQVFQNAEFTYLPYLSFFKKSSWRLAQHHYFFKLKLGEAQQAGTGLRGVWAYIHIRHSESGALELRLVWEVAST